MMRVHYCKIILFLTWTYLGSVAQSYNQSLALSQKMNESEPQQSALAEPKKKALIALFGVLSRSTRMTWPQIEKMVVAPLTTDYDVSVYALDNQLDNVDSIDGTPIQPSSQATIKSLWPVHYQPISQSEMDADLARNYRDDQGYLPGLYARKVRRCQGTNHCQKCRMVVKNAKRQIYQEQLVSDYLVKNGQQYDIVIAIGADFYPLLPLDVQQIAPQLDDHQAWLFTSPQAPAGGVTNGFYIGKPQTVAKAMSMLKTAKLDVFPQLENLYYEDVLAMTLQIHQVKSVIGPMYFCKMRNSGICAYHQTCRFGARCRDGLTEVYDGLSPEHRSAVKDELSRLKLYRNWRLKHLRPVLETLFGLSAEIKST